MSPFFWWQLGCVLCLCVAIVLHRIAVIEFKVFSVVFALGLLVWLLSGLISLIALLLAGAKFGLAHALLSHGAGSLLAIMLLVAVGSLMVQAKKVPAIHNISTDVAAPPLFDKVLAVRKPHHNALEYTDTIKRQQLLAYPELRPLRLDASPAVVFDQALVIAQDLGWQLHDQSKDNGVIEASDTSKLFGFVDDIVIRIRAEEQGSVVDMRSISRLGVSDLGANAKRIQDFLKCLQQAHLADQS